MIFLSENNVDKKVADKRIYEIAEYHKTGLSANLALTLYREKGGKIRTKKFYEIWRSFKTNDSKGKQTKISGNKKIVIPEKLKKQILPKSKLYIFRVILINNQTKKVATTTVEVFETNLRRAKAESLSLAEREYNSTNSPHWIALKSKLVEVNRIQW